MQMLLGPWGGRQRGPACHSRKLDWAGPLGQAHEGKTPAGDLSLFLPIKESDVTDIFLGICLKDEALKVMPVQKQTCAGQWTRFKASDTTWDYNGQDGLGIRCFKEVAIAFHGDITMAKLSIVPMRGDD